jgi:hypothetical protein
MTVHPRSAARVLRILGSVTALAAAAVFPGANGVAAAPVTGRFSSGLNLHPLQWHYDRYRPSEALALAAREGASVVRIDVHWSWLEFAGPGIATWYQPQLTALDRFLAEAARLHIAVMATVLDTPCWAAVSPASRCGDPATFAGNHPPLTPAVFARFLRRLVAHVGTRIQYYEIWNEPNIAHFWRAPNPAAYTRLLKAAYITIKRANPSAMVLGGATSGADLSFIERMYRAGAKGFFDGLSIHPYSGQRAPDVCTAPRRSFECGVEAVHRLMLQYGDLRPIWLTEFGVSLGRGIDPAGQAAYVSSAFSCISRWPYVEGALWYELYDDPSGHDGEHFGLFDGRLDPRPSAQAFEQAVAALS